VIVRGFIVSSALCVASASRADPLIAKSTLQLVIVTSDGWRADHAKLQRWERAKGGSFHVVDPALTVVLGSTGLGWGAGEDEALSEEPKRAATEPTKREGDKRAPAGVFVLDGAFGDLAAAPPGTRISYRATSPTLLCVDDPASADYNRIVEGAEARPHASAEHMRVGSGVYALGLVISHNAARTPQRGSCVFMHIWDSKERPTVGCTALARAELATVIAWLNPAAQPRLVQLPRPVYRARKAAWGLP